MNHVYLKPPLSRLRTYLIAISDSWLALVVIKMTKQLLYGPRLIVGLIFMLISQFTYNNYTLINT